jgi:predicted nuclease of predicted toxin-antitoxin system
LLENWILITNDKDFGEKIYREKQSHRGIIFLRLQNQKSTTKIDILQRLLTSHKNQLKDNYIVVTETKVRVIKTSSN